MTCCVTTQCAVDPIPHHPGYAITGKRRVPNVPTSPEAGVPGFDVTTWYGMYTPAQHAETDRGCARYRSEKGAQDPALINRVAELSMTPVEGSARLGKDAGLAQRSSCLRFQFLTFGFS
jgi:hypothetical protein